MSRKPLTFRIRARLKKNGEVVSRCFHAVEVDVPTEWEPPRNRWKFIYRDNWSSPIEWKMVWELTVPLCNFPESEYDLYQFCLGLLVEHVWDINDTVSLVNTTREAEELAKQVKKIKSSV